MGQERKKAHPQPLKKHTHPPQPVRHQPAHPSLAKGPKAVVATKIKLPVANAAPSHEEIAAEAEVLWRQEGCPKDRDAAIWLEAERKLVEVARAFRNAQDPKVIAEPLSRLDPKTDDVMGELEELFPS